MPHTGIMGLRMMNIGTPKKLNGKTFLRGLQQGKGVGGLMIMNTHSFHHVEENSIQSSIQVSKWERGWQSGGKKG